MKKQAHHAYFVEVSTGEILIGTSVDTSTWCAEFITDIDNCQKDIHWSITSTSYLYLGAIPLPQTTLETQLVLLVARLDNEGWVNLFSGGPVPQQFKRNELVRRYKSKEKVSMSEAFNAVDSVLEKTIIPALKAIWVTRCI